MLRSESICGQFREECRGQRIGDIFQRIEQYYPRHWVRPAAFQ
jgi:hypothetical protein